MLGSPLLPFLLTYESIIALTVHITALFITGYLLRLPNKASGTRWFAAFFVGISVVSAAIFLEASILVWGDLFFALRVVGSLGAQASMVQFAYHFPAPDQPREARLLLGFHLALILAALVASGSYIGQFLSDPIQPAENSHQLLSLLLPIGVLTVIAVLLRRTFHLHRQELQRRAVPLRHAEICRALLAPANPPAAATRSFGVVLLIGIMPAATPLLLGAGHISALAATYIVGLGTLLVHLGLFLVFLNSVRASSSFITRMFSIALVLLLALFGVIALLMTSARNEQFRQTRAWQLVAIRQEIANNSLNQLPPALAYIAVLPAPGPTDTASRLYPPPGSTITGLPPDLPFIAREDQLRRAGNPTLDRIGVRTMDYLRYLTAVPGFAAVLRYADQPIGTIPRYVAYQFQVDGQSYEAGFALTADLSYITRENLRLVFLLIASSLLLWIALRLFLHSHLLQPLNALLGGIRQADAGTSQLDLPVRHEDEIGFLTHSFNTMVQTINTARRELHEANQLLEERVQERTAALQAEMQERQQASRQINDQQQSIAMLRERERLARELHDNLGQVLAYVNAQSQAAAELLNQGQAAAARNLLEQLAEVARSVLGDVREYILGVQVGTKLQPARPELRRSTFVGVLETYLREFEGLWHIPTTLQLSPGARDMAFAPTIETHLIRIVQEALTNVRKHAAAGQVEVAVKVPFPLLEAEEDPERILAVTIRDDGQGFAAAEVAGREVHGGQGYGLSSMQGRVAEIGGRLSIDSVPGAGTSITVEVPLRRQGDVIQQALRLLLVDDNELFLQGLQSLLSVNGFQVIGTAGNGTQALEQARALQPDVILMDVQMPEVDGLQATRAIKAELPAIQIVMLTVSDDDAHLFEAIKAGASGYLLKSLESSEFCPLLLGLMRGEVPFSHGLAARVLLAFAEPDAKSPPAATSAEPDTPLSEQQIALLTLLAQGYTQQEIGEQLGYTRRTVSRHLAGIIELLQVGNRAEAIAYARRKLAQGEWPDPADG